MVKISNPTYIYKLESNGLCVVRLSLNSQINPSNAPLSFYAKIYINTASNIEFRLEIEDFWGQDLILDIVSMEVVNTKELLSISTISISNNGTLLITGKVPLIGLGLAFTNTDLLSFDAVFSLPKESLSTKLHIAKFRMIKERFTQLSQYINAPS
jgi:hypothetical protein